MTALHLRLALAAAWALAGCEPELNVGEWQCAPGEDAAIQDANGPIALPWSTGFEDQFCDYTQLAGLTS